MDHARDDFAHHLRRRRRLRGWTQLELSLAAEVSTRHLSWLETGRAQPSRAMVLRLAERLDLPLRERNRWLQAAGFAPMFGQHAWTDAPMAQVRDAVSRLLAAYEPWPALAVDAAWDVVDANAAARRLLHLLDAAPSDRLPNVMRLVLHPDGLGDLIDNAAQVRAHLWERLRRAMQGDAAPRLQALHDELMALAPPVRAAADAPAAVEPVLPLVLGLPAGRLSFLTTVTVFGAPLDVGAAELAIETLMPADAGTAERLRALAALPAPEFGA